jgi:hypothetical protein
MLAITSMVFGIAMTLFIKMGEADSSLGPFANSVIILVWMLSILMMTDGIFHAIRGKSSVRLKSFGVKLFGVCLWALPICGLVLEAGLNRDVSVICVIVAIFCGAKFTAKII